jgi:REP element-mobilizing transposase RayT
MARLPRSTFPDYGVWHATTRGVGRRAVYLDRDDGRRFLTQLWQGVERLGLHVHALCLMPNHYHLVVECMRDRLSRALHRVNGLYAADFNAKYGRSGHLWGDRFALWQVRDDEHLQAACEYVLANPVRAGLCERTDDWRWSWSRYSARAASSVISGTPASACETGQPVFAASAASRKPSASRPGTLPRTVSALFVIPVPGTKVTTAEVRSCSGGVPAFASPMDSAIEKHEACAAAISSSGLVFPPDSSSERAAQLTSSGPKAPEPTSSIVPDPLIRSPFHVTDARRSAAMSAPLSSSTRVRRER